MKFIFLLISLLIFIPTVQAAAVKPWIVKVEVGFRETCILTSTAQVRCWGQYTEQALGNENQNIIDLSVGADKACVRFFNGQYKCFNEQIYPITDLSEGQQILASKVGGESFCVLLSDGAVNCQSNGFGLNGNFVQILSPADAKTATLYVSGSVYCLNAKSDLWCYAKYNSLEKMKIDPRRKVSQVAVGDAHICVLLDNNILQCWGENGFGQMGLGQSKVVPFDGEPVTISLDRGLKVKKIAAGALNTCVIYTTGTLKCWGYNGDAQLGLGGFESRGTGIDEQPADLPFVNLGALVRVVQVGISETHACAVLEGGKMKCWGSGTDGQLIFPIAGNANSDFIIGDEPGEMGNKLPTIGLMAP